MQPIKNQEEGECPENPGGDNTQSNVVRSRYLYWLTFSVPHRGRTQTIERDVTVLVELPEQEPEGITDTTGQPSCSHDVTRDESLYSPKQMAVTYQPSGACTTAIARTYTGYQLERASESRWASGTDTTESGVYRNIYHGGSLIKGACTQSDRAKKLGTGISPVHIPPGGLPKRSL